ncbi:MAG TPA: hypothetical protein VGJ44_06305 [Kribbellaceae bacterium]|jgi:hypothetical protein
MTPESSERTRELYDEVAAKLADAGVAKGSMFGMPCLKVGKKMLGGIWGDAMNFKLPPRAREAALALPGAEPFDPGMGRPMKEWVVVPLAQADRWPELAEQALEYVRE